MMIDRVKAQQLNRLAFQFSLPGKLLVVPLYGWASPFPQVNYVESGPDYGPGHPEKENRPVKRDHGSFDRRSSPEVCELSGVCGVGHAGEQEIAFQNTSKNPGSTKHSFALPGFYV